MSIKDRIEKLEQHTGADEPGVTIIYVKGNSEAETEAAKEKAIAEYRDKHPGWEPDNLVLYISVISEECKKLTEEIIAGEGR